MKKKRFEILSPDKIPIEDDGGYTSFQAAINAFNHWQKRFEKQGYYSSNAGRIELEELQEHCTLIEI